MGFYLQTSIIYNVQFTANVQNIVFPDIYYNPLFLVGPKQFFLNLENK